MGSSTIILYIIIAVISVSVFMQYENFTNDVTYSTSTVDGKPYLVRNLPDKEGASNLLATIRGRCIVLVQYMTDKYPNDEAVGRLKKKFRPDNISEGTKDSKYTSYSVNKGEKIVFCLRSRDENEELVDDNVMMFVALHELAHVMSKSVGHTEEFWDNFRFLLKQGIQAGVYVKQDFRKKPVKYCGTDITDTPLND
jgi:hypothetical protein